MKKNFKFQISNFKLNKGFTLIELLTVIAIIGVLTAILTVSYLQVRMRGRDAQRKSDIRQIQSALELYRSDNDVYPASTGAYTPLASCGIPFSSPSVTYMNTIPCDPTSHSAYYYYQGTNTTSYALASCLENTNDASGTSVAPGWWPTSWPPISSANCPSQYFYAVENP